MNTLSVLAKSTSFLKKFTLLGLAILFLILVPKLALADQEINFPAREVTYRGGDCEGNHSVWVHIYDDGTREIQADHGIVAGECGNPSEFQPTQVEASSCPDDVYYPDNGRNIHKHGGYWSGSECVYAFDDAGPVDNNNQPSSNEPVNPGIDNSSNSDSNSSSNSRSQATATVKNKIKITNNNYQTQSQVVYVTQAQQAAQVIIRERDKHTPAAVETTRISYTAEQSNLCPANTTKVVNGGNVDCVVNSQSQQVVYAQQPQVITVAGDSQVKELPKTGVPLAALALGALLPAGLKLRRFGRQSQDINPNYIWEERALNRVQ